MVDLFFAITFVVVVVFFFTRNQKQNNQHCVTCNVDYAHVCAAERLHPVYEMGSVSKKCLLSTNSASSDRGSI